ncbi:MAG: sialate O-acetylesterase [Saprospiraceae bacterium]
MQFLFLSSLVAQNAGLSISPVFADGSVWQRNQEIHLRGAAPAGAVVSFSSEDFGESMAVVDKDGAWIMKLRAHEAGGPYGATLNLKVKGKNVPGERILLQDIYIGDVYLLSGQSNMEWLVSNSNNGVSASAKTNPLIRHFKVPLIASRTPKTELPYITWKYAQPGQTENFSAIGYYFAEALLEKNPGVPIGLINSSWGGSRIEAWLPSYATGKSGKEIPAEMLAAWEKLQKKYPKAFDGEGEYLLPHGKSGEAVDVGRKWEWTGFPDINGRIWYDRVVDLTEAETLAPARLHLGAIDDSDHTYLNGLTIGKNENAYSKTRIYTVPVNGMQVGMNHFSVKITDTGGAGGFVSSPDSMYLVTASRKIPLGEGWRMRPEYLEVDTVGQTQHQPEQLYNAMIRPLRDLKVSGVLWYQGESNTGDEGETNEYAVQLKQLSKMFRKEAGQADVPFFVVELPDWLPTSEPNHQLYAHWAMMRQAQRTILAEPNTSVTVTLGYGDTKNIHPENKRPVSRMLADEAMRLVYGVEDGPRFSTEIELEKLGDAMIVRFGNVGSGLKSSDGKAINGFAVQGTDGKWYDAEATVQNKDRVRLLGPIGVKLQAVSYAWSNNPDEANMVNEWRRAVSSFRMGLNE